MVPNYSIGQLTLPKNILKEREKTSFLQFKRGFTSSSSVASYRLLFMQKKWKIKQSANEDYKKLVEFIIRVWSCDCEGGGQAKPHLTQPITSRQTLTNLEEAHFPKQKKNTI